MRIICSQLSVFAAHNPRWVFQRKEREGPYVPGLLRDANEQDEYEDAQNPENESQLEGEISVWKTTPTEPILIILTSMFTDVDKATGQPYLFTPLNRKFVYSSHDLTLAGDLSHLNEHGVAELSKLDEGLHPAADVHFVLFSDLQTVDCLLGVRLHLQLQYRKTRRKERENNHSGKEKMYSLITARLRNSYSWSLRELNS